MADMNLTPADAGLTAQIWDGKFFPEYVRANRFARYMGDSMNSLIQVNEDLTVKRGNAITFATVRRLVGAGVTGDVILEGNEEILDQRSMKLVVNPIRHAVAMSEWDEQQSSIDMRNAARQALKNWSIDKMRGDIINALSAIGVPGTVTGSSVTFANATAAQRNAWMAANFDRIRFGNSAAYASSGVMATALGNITTTTDIMTGKLLSLVKRQAETASPHIRPIKVDDDSDEEWFVCFMPTPVFRDFQQDPAVQTLNGNSRPRERDWMDNPLFSGRDLIWNGIIVREIQELPILTGAGNGGINVAASYLCGAQAIGMGWAQRTKTTTNVRDYGFMHGVGLQEIRAINKLVFGRDPANDQSQEVDQGIATIFTTALPDS